MTDETNFEAETKPVNNLDILDNKDVCYAAYILNLLAPFNGITAFIAFILVLVKKSEASDLINSHYTYQLRTFVIGLLGAIISGVLMLVLIGFVTILLVGIWWIARSAIGLKYLIEDKPIPNPDTWLV